VVVQPFPKDLVEKRYGYKVSDEFLEILRTATVRITHGTASFVSPDGLLFTNHHVGRTVFRSSAPHSTIISETAFTPPRRRGENLSRHGSEGPAEDRGRDCGRAGRRRAGHERSRGQPRTQERHDANREAVRRFDRQHLRRGVVLFRRPVSPLPIKKYTDIRLVFAPEADIAAFGGDPDNYTYPRYCLDFSLFRVYENGKPIHPRATSAGAAKALKKEILSSCRAIRAPRAG
jgi:hypothetical protein